MEILAKSCAPCVLACLILVLSLCSMGICQQECDTPVELGFLVDRSGSISKQDFEKVKSFVLTVIGGFDVSKKGTHIGIISYSSDAKTIISFNQFDDSNFDYGKLNDTIRDGLASPEGGTTRIDLALEKADQELFSDITKYRSFVPKILLILTDGQQTREGDIDADLSAATRKLSRKGVEVFVLGVGDSVIIPELLEIAADKDENVYLADNFDELETVVEGLVSSFCKVCKRNVDIAFLIPTVSNTLQDVKVIVNAMLLTFGIKKYGGVHVGIITCAEQSDVMLKLNENYIRAEIQDILESLQIKGSQVVLDKCLREASSDMFDVKGGVRNSVDKYLIVFDDGSSLFVQPAVNNAISTLRSQGIIVMGMAMGSNPAAETKMRTISHVPKSVWLKPARQREVQNAAFFARSVSEVLCKEKPGKCPYTDESEPCEGDAFYDECDLDSDRARPCLDDMICCENPCGRRCVSPMPDCFSPVEIALLVDSSGTQGDKYKEDILEKLKRFSKELVHGFSITETTARVAIVTYSDEAKVNKDLGSGQSFRMVVNNIDDIKLSNKPNRNLEEALRFTNENIFSLKGGLRKIGRRVLVVLSSGEPTNRETSLSSVTRSLTDQGVDIWAIHGGADTSSYLTEVVSQSSYLLSSLDEDLEDFKKNFVMSVCSSKEGICRSPTCPSDGTDQCRQDYLCPGQEKCCPGTCRSCVETKTDCRYPMDLAFIVQNSMSESDFNEVKSFMKDVMDALEVGRTNTYIGVITFNKNAKIDLEFSSSVVSGAERKTQVLFDAIDKISASGDRSTTGAVEAFELAKNRLFTTDAGSHPNEIRNVIFISNGNLDQPEEMTGAARNLRADISNIFPISLTNDIDVNTLEKIAVPDGEKNVYLTTSYSSLDQYRNKIAVDLCKRGFLEASSKNHLLARRARDLQFDSGFSSGGNLNIEDDPVVLVRGPPGNLGYAGRQGGEGEPGPQGPKGAPGDFGTTGIPGVVGEHGNSGALGLYGLVGPPGHIEIERSGLKGPIFDGYVMRSAEQNFSVIIATEITKNPKRGARGPKGLKGVPGPRGGVGELGGIGKYGLCGGEGVVGATGRVGIPGMQGSRGIFGSPGGDGIIGEKGEVGEGGGKGTKGEKGPRGDRGERGIMGDDGEVGDPGESGLLGGQGNRGKRGARGEPGTDGEAGFKGFTGGQGDDGQRGLIGKQGELGPPGPIGFRGIPGHPGFQGSFGFYGTVGEPGAIGDVGDEGIKGKSGSNGKRGQDGPPGKPGELGDPGIKGNPGFTGQRGESGANGDVGENAENGETGDPGTDGANGPQGDRGLMGEKGVAGVDALPGSEGRMGAVGQAGTRGGRGLDGPPGPKGELGPDGRPGPPGHITRPGYVGRPGERGEKGERGDSGLSGTRGISGQKGFPGDRGPIGFPGLAGSPGRPGTDGYYGSHGTSGDPGLSGVPGQRGPPGLQGRPGQEGEAGPRGTIGGKGFPGPPGFPGQPGVAAPPGPNGFPGESGDAGRAGTPGSFGFSGRLGEDGLIGDKGPQGSAGIPGTAGRPGPPGLKGSQGAVGDKGFSGRPGGTGSRGGRGGPGPKGALGIQGDDGGRGREGDRGPKGQVGLPGIDGTKGEPGRRGKLGKVGKNGDPGNPGGQGQAGADGTKGDKGSMGDPGKLGTPGDPGRDGMYGTEGRTGGLGPAGFQAEAGVVGLPGLDGLPGPKGPEGDAGLPGIGGLNGGAGHSGPLGSIGPRGERGQKGTAGTGTLPGEPGSRGPEGFLGSLGRAGTSGASGDKGEIGDKGFSGDEGELGEKGTLGPVGEDGQEGEKGAKGSKGENGDRGTLGTPGIDGDLGPPGKMGGAGEPALHGLPGVSGKTGTRGQKGVQAAQGPKGANGNDGKQGQIGAAGPIGEKGDSSVLGPKGMQGDPGEPGVSVDGTVGPPGPPGPTGDAGLHGEKGEKGAPGPTGPKGIGIRGENGTVGVAGTEPGKPGNKGVKGDIGRAGVNAVQGEKGEKGIVGLPGQDVKGDSGAVGTPGAVGVRGPPGPTVDGPQGLAGNRGPKGVIGSQGSPGPSGRAGTQAVSFNGTTIIIRHNATYSEYIPIDTNSNISRRYFSIQRNLAFLKKPNGSQLFPAISCAVLYSHYPDNENGWYWIDPNQGSHEDAEEVYCDFEHNATCLEPVQNKIENKKWFSGSDGYRWLTDELDGLQSVDQFNYTFDDGQLQMLQLHSSKAWQSITYHCLNSVPWGNFTQNAIKLRGDDDLEFHNKMPRKLRPVVIEDNCQTKNDTWGKTTLEVQAKDPANLPIRDIAVYDVGDDGEEFGLELGRVCFAP